MISSTPGSSGGGKRRPASTRTSWSWHSKTIEFRPISPSPPRGMTRSTAREPSPLRLRDERAPRRAGDQPSLRRGWAGRAEIAVEPVQRLLDQLRAGNEVARFVADAPLVLGRSPEALEHPD